MDPQGRLRRALDRWTTTMALGTVAAIGVALVAPARNLLTPPPVAAARRGLAEAARKGGWAVGPIEPGNEPRVRAVSREVDEPHDSGPLDHPGTDNEALLNLLTEHARRPESPSSPSSMMVKRAVELRDRADDAGKVLHKLDAGSRVDVVTRVGEWALVMTRFDAMVAFGWLRQAELQSR